ncbi:hypothetical protein Tco_1010834 [Tanacetum coccineum]
MRHVWSKSRSPVCWGRGLGSPTDWSELIQETKEKIVLIQAIGFKSSRSKKELRTIRNESRWERSRLGIELCSRLELPQELRRVHHTFHVSNLKRCYADEPLVMSLEGIHVDDKLQFVEEPVEIMEQETKRLK